MFVLALSCSERNGGAPSCGALTAMAKQWFHALMGASARGWLSGLRAYAALIFGRSTAVGLLMLGASSLDLVAGLTGILAVISARIVVSLLGYRRDLAEQGFFGYNALLCGLALGHGQPLTPILVGEAVVLGVAATLLTASLSEWLDRVWGLPSLVLPFVLVMSFPWQKLPTRRYSVLVGAAAVPDLPIQLPSICADVLRALGSIVFNPTTSAGVLVLLAGLLASRILAMFSVLGVAVAMLLGRFTFSHLDPIWIQTAGYNSLLACAALGTVFFVPSVSAAIGATLGALASAWLTFVMAPTFTRLGVPLLAWPFVIVTLLILRALALRHPGRAPHPPALPNANGESNLDHNRMLRARFGLPGPVRLFMPVQGTWTVTQGFNGPHTHQPPWQHALDFEITDADGFPFRGQGLAATEYYCFDTPVCAPLAGTVVFVYAEHQDNPPGTQDLNYPFGNVVIIQHGPTLFSVLAHLRQGSAGVKVGQSLSAGTPVARCGSSGRSPRPHVHLQLQSSGYLGVPTLPFQLLQFATLCDGPPRYVPFGIPAEGDRVAPAELALVPELPILKVGAEFALNSQGRLRKIRSEISPIGLRSLLDLTTGDRLYFSDLDGVAAFTTYAGRPKSPLAILALALPRVPPFGGQSVMTETVMPEWIFPGWLHRLNSLGVTLGIGAKITSQTHAHRSAVVLDANTSLEIRWLGHLLCRYAATVEMQDGTVTSLSVTRGVRTLVKAMRAVVDDSAIFETTLSQSVSMDRILAYLTIPVIAGVALLSLLLTSSPSVARSVPAPLAESYRLEVTGELTRSIDAAANAVSELPQAYFPRLRLAYLEAQAGRHEASASDYALAAKLAPDAVEPLLGQLKSLVATEHFENAVTVADSILRIDSKNYFASSRRAWALYRLGRYQAAAEGYSSVIELYPGDIEMRLGKAYSLSGAKRPVEARIEFREVLNRAPSDRQARTALGLP